jgi:hypothetical protein
MLCIAALTADLSSHPLFQDKEVTMSPGFLYDVEAPPMQFTTTASFSINN